MPHASSLLLCLQISSSESQMSLHFFSLLSVLRDTKRNVRGHPGRRPVGPVTNRRKAGRESRKRGGAAAPSEQQAHRCSSIPPNSGIEHLRKRKSNAGTLVQAHNVIRWRASASHSLPPSLLEWVSGSSSCLRFSARVSYPRGTYICTYTNGQTRV